MAVRDYIYYDLAVSVCVHCLKKLEAKIIFQDQKVYMLKTCPEHGKQKVLIATDIDYYKKTREFLKPGDMPRKFTTPVKYGCPYDCGLCSDHEQHSCVTVLEVTERCNLSCPTCYAGSGPAVGRHKSLDEIDFMLAALMRSEGEPDVVQLSGGEPTLHPDFFAIMDRLKALPIRHIMINTNGIRLAKDEAFAARLASYAPGIEIYMQFDSLEARPLEVLRGEDLRGVREAALLRLNALNLSTTLVVTLQKGLNDHEIGDILKFATQQIAVRGVTFQPTQIAGRLEGFDPETQRLTLTEVRQAILDQADLFQPDDLVPVPCHPDAIMMGYGLKLGSEIHPLTRYFSPEDLLSSRNTVNFESLPEIQAKLIGLFSTGNSPESCDERIADIMCCLPKIDTQGLNYGHMFRVIVMKFYDAYDFDVRGVKKACVHIVHSDGRIIPFDTMNLFYRDPLVEQRLKGL